MKQLYTFIQQSSYKKLYQFKYNFYNFCKRYIHKSDDSITHNVKNNLVDKTPITAQLWQMRKIESSKDMLLNNHSNIVHPIELISKTTLDSKLTLSYKFCSDSHLRDLYIDHKGNILIGKLFEDLDALAGNIANKHCDDDNSLTKRLTLVTASVDKIIQKKVISINEDIIITGQIAWVGKSSLDVLVEIHKSESTDYLPNIGYSNSDSLLLSSYFTYVAKYKDSNKSAMVNPLLIKTPIEETLHKQRLEASNLRKKLRSDVLSHVDSGTKTSCSVEKSRKATYSLEKMQQLIEVGNVMEDMPALAPSHAVLMKYTGLENSFLCQPQNVNTGGRVFGGFIMHRAYDLALTTGYIFAGTLPIFLEVDKIAFQKPVDIGDLLRLKSRVIYSSDSIIKPVIVVEVNCQVVRPERASSFISNSFYFVFGFNHAVTLRKILPVTFEEAQKLILGSQVAE